MTCILEGELFLSGIHEYNTDTLKQNNIHTIINVAKECEHYDDMFVGFRKYNFLFDDEFVDIHDEIPRVVNLIESELKFGAVLIHCRAGMSRSATFALAFIMKHKNLTITDAYRLVKEKRPIKPNPSFMMSLMRYEADLFGTRSFMDFYDGYSVDYIMELLDAPNCEFLNIRQRFIDKNRDVHETCQSLYYDPLFTIV